MILSKLFFFLLLLFLLTNPLPQIYHQSSLSNISPILFIKLLSNPLHQTYPQSSSTNFSPILFIKLLTNPLRQLRSALCATGPHPSRKGSAHSVYHWTSIARIPSYYIILDFNRQGLIAMDIIIFQI